MGGNRRNIFNKHSGLPDDLEWNVIDPQAKGRDFDEVSLDPHEFDKRGKSTTLVDLLDGQETVDGGDFDFHPGQLRSIPEEDWRGGFANEPEDEMPFGTDEPSKKKNRLQKRLGALSKGGRDRLNKKEETVNTSLTSQKTKAELAKEAAEAEKQRQKEQEAKVNAEVCNFMANALKGMM